MSAILEPDVLGGPYMWFLVLSRPRVARVTPNVPYIVISITDPDRPEAVIAECPLRMAVLRLAFDDVDVAGSIWKAPSEEDAEAIVRFVAERRSMADLIVCQCEAGMSRSAGVAAALSRWLNGHDEEFFERYLPNRRIYRLILDRLGYDGVILPK
jgi:predicted protein tyrosine phosphatase